MTLCPFFFLAFQFQKNCACSSERLVYKGNENLLSATGGNRSLCPLIVNSEKLNLPMHIIIVKVSELHTYISENLYMTIILEKRAKFIFGGRWFLNWYSVGLSGY